MTFTEILMTFAKETTKDRIVISALKEGRLHPDAVSCSTCHHAQKGKWRKTTCDFCIYGPTQSGMKDNYIISDLAAADLEDGLTINAQGYTLVTK